MSKGAREWAIAIVSVVFVGGGLLWLWNNEGTVEVRICAIDETTLIRYGAFNVETTEGKFHVTNMTLPGDFPDPDELRKKLQVGKMVKISYRESSHSRETIYKVEPLPDDPSAKCPS